jgi:phage terminase large subunit GpA-like protein
MLRDTPVLAEITGDLKSRDADQRILKRSFRNGASITFVGANSPGGFRRITCRVACFDEVDGYPAAGAGVEGDQIALGAKRTETFWNRKIILGSTPTVKSVSRIEREWEKSDKRRYHVPCPHCGTKQTIKFANIRWDKDPETGERLTKDAYLVCEGNGCIIQESFKPWMIENGEWIAENPFSGHAGFHIWAGYSLFPNASWANLAEEFIRCHKDPALLRTFTNLVLGETWEENTEKVDPHGLMERLEDWGENAPSDVLAVTCGIDVQDSRLEVETVGWGVGEESWSLDYRIIYGDPSSPTVWQELTDYLNTPIIREDGRELQIRLACIDSGGHHTQTVYRYAKQMYRSGVRAIKGREEGPVWPPSAKANNKPGSLVYMVGTRAAKDAIYARIQSNEPGPGYCHFPAGRDVDYFNQLTAEQVQVKFFNGFPKRVYFLPAGKRNEALDCRVYAYAALQALKPSWGKLLADSHTAQKRRMAPPPVKQEDEPSVSVQAQALSRGRTFKESGGWLQRRNGWIR